jgi:hypothetical protein
VRRRSRAGAGHPERPADVTARRAAGRVLFNHFFFMHFSTLSLDEYLDEMDELLADLPRFYETIVRDIYGQGVALGRKKYRLLRWSYSMLLAGVAGATLAALAQALLA